MKTGTIKDHKLHPSTPFGQPVIAAKSITLFLLDEEFESFRVIEMSEYRMFAGCDARTIFSSRQFPNSLLCPVPF